MEKSKEQILLEKLRKAGRKTRIGMMPPPGFPGMRIERGEMPPHHGRGMPGPGEHAMPGPMFVREMLLMSVLEAGDQGIRQKDIAEEMGINASSLSEQLDRLETDRYLVRRENPEDKRSTLIFLTEKGRARAYEVLDERQHAAEKICGKLTEKEKDTLIELLDKLLES